MVSPHVCRSCSDKLESLSKDELIAMIGRSSFAFATLIGKLGMLDTEDQDDILPPG